MSPNSPSDPSQDTTSPGAAHGYAAVRVSAPPALTPGSLLANRYEIIRQLGQGGMGAVYQARDIELDRMVAIKVIRPELANDRSILQRFKQELVLARQVTHRNVVRIYDLGEAEGLKFITMEYVEGVDLKTVLRTQGKLPASEAVQIMQQVSRALDAAHSEGVIHRDLKPSNVMRDAQGKVLVMDFGLARSGEGSGLTQTGAMVGTLEYMAPEQARGDPVDARSDIYAAGLIFYELLTGKMPFPAESAIASLMRRAHQRATPASDVEKTVPRVLSGIVSRCLEPERETRYQSAAELMADLEAFQPSSSRTWTTIVSPRPAVTPRLYKWMTIVLAVLLVAGAGTLAWRHYTKALPAQHAPVSVLVADFENASSDPVFDGTLEPAFTLALEGAPFISSYSRGQAHKLAEQLQPGTTKLDEQAARLVATREGVNVVIGGDIARDGDAYRVTVRAVDGVTGKAIASDSEQVQKKDVLVAMGKVAAEIRKALGDTTPKSVQLAAAETFSSTSLEAAQHYARGQDLSAAGKHEDALREYEEAIKLDPQLGRAYSGMAVAEYVLGHRAETEKYYKLALENIGRMSDREKYRSRGGYYLVVAREPDKAIEEFSALVHEYPADSAGLGMLAFAYFSKRDMARALQEGRRALEIYPKSVPIRNNVGLYAMYAGDFDTSIKEHQQVLSENPKFLLAYVGEAMSQLGKGDVEAARGTWQTLQAVSERGASMAVAGLADLALYQGRLREADSILEPAIATDLKEKNNDAAGSKLALLISAYISSGQAAKAVSAADRARAASKDPGIEYMAARGYIEGGQEKKALALAQEMSNSLAPDPQLYAKLIQGEVAMRQGRAREAIERFRESVKFGDSWLMHFALGRAYLAADAYPEADSEFEICLKRRGEATAVFLDDNPTYHMLPPVHYYIGRAQQGLKSPAAAESYKTFLAMKATADGDLLAADTKKRITAH